MTSISHRVAALNESQSLQMAARCRQLKAEGVDVISLSLGEPDFATPDAINAAAHAAIDADYSHYGPGPGFPELREAIAQSINGQMGIAHCPLYDKDDIIVSVGAKQAISNAILALINQGDEVITPTPCWVSYSELVKLAEGVPVAVPTTLETEYKMTSAQLEAAITPKTKMLIICSPNNPTGSVYTHDELEAIVAVLERHPQVFVISDEIYANILYTGHHESMAQFASVRERVILINGVSKAYAMTGYRIGWMASTNHELIAAVKKLQGQEITCATTVAQKAAEAAYRGSQDCVEQMRRIFEHRRNVMLALLRDIPSIRIAEPQGAFYLFPDVSSYYGKGNIHSSSDMADYLLNEAHVACVAGSAFGEDKCIRFSYATDEDSIREAMRRIKNALSTLV